MSFSRKQFGSLVGEDRAREALGLPPSKTKRKTKPRPEPTKLECHVGEESGKHTLTIIGWTPTPLNQLLGNHWKAHRLKKADREVIIWAQHCVRLPTAVTRRRVSLQIVFGKGQRRCDPDAYWKTVNDALVHAKLLVNDNPRWCQLGSVDVSREETAATRILLEDIPEEISLFR